MHCMPEQYSNDVPQRKIIHIDMDCFLTLECNHQEIYVRNLNSTKLKQKALANW